MRTTTLLTIVSQPFSLHAPLQMIARNHDLTPDYVLCFNMSAGIMKDLRQVPGCSQDIKSANVLLKKGDAKVADVGLSQLLRSSFAASCSFGVGTFSWAATELLLGSHPVSLACLGPTVN